MGNGFLLLEIYRPATPEDKEVYRYTAIELFLAVELTFKVDLELDGWRNKLEEHGFKPKRSIQCGIDCIVYPVVELFKN